MPEPRVKLLLIITRPNSAMLDACGVITALMKRPENNFQLTMGCWKFNYLLTILGGYCNVSDTKIRNIISKFTFFSKFTISNQLF